MHRQLLKTAIRNTVLAAIFIPNIGNIYLFSSSKQLAKLAGVAPHEHSSIKSKRQYLNMLGDRALHSALYTLVLNLVQEKYNPIMYNYYQSKQHSGKKKIQALTDVMRRLVKIVYRMMQDKTAYRSPAPLEEDARQAKGHNPISESCFSQFIRAML